MFLSITMIGCTQNNNEEIESLKREVDGLKSANDNLMNQIKKVDLILSGDFSVTVQKVIVGDPTRNIKDTALVNFFQSSLFLLPVGEKTAKQLKEGQTYTFKFLDSTIKDYSALDFKNGDYSIESFLNEYAVEFELVGVAKETETGLNSNRIDIKEKSE